jgi:hypothetical protein
VTGTWTVCVVVVVSTVVVGTVVWATAGCCGVEELIGALDVWVETEVEAGAEIGAFVVGAGVDWSVVDAGAGFVVDWSVVAARAESLVGAVEVVSSAWRA